MDRKSALIVAGSVVVGFLVLGLTQVWAQRFPPDERGARGAGRYQVVRANADVIVLLDTTTGDLYSALPRDIQPYNARFRSDGKYYKDTIKEDFRDEKKDADFRKDERKKPDEPKKGDFKKDEEPKKGDFDKKDPTKRDFDKKSDFKKDVDEKKGDFDKKSVDLKKSEEKPPQE